MLTTATRWLTVIMALAMLATTPNLASGKSRGTPKTCVWEKIWPGPDHVGQNPPQVQNRIGLRTSATEKLPQVISFGQWILVEDVYDTGKWEVVYNLRIADYHTYFVTDWDWGFSVWSHNTNANCEGTTALAGPTRTESVTRDGRSYRVQYKGVDSGNANGPNVYRVIMIDGPVVDSAGNRGANDLSARDRFSTYLCDELNRTISNTYSPGHLIGATLGGPADTRNLVPQLRGSAFNGPGGGYWQMEQWVRVGLRENPGVHASMTVSPQYPADATGLARFIPTSFSVSVRFGNQPSGVHRFAFQQRTTRQDFERMLPEGWTYL